MKILIVDQDRLAVQLLRSKLEPLGHEVTEETAKSNIIEQLNTDQYDVILLDPTPLTSPRQIILDIKRSLSNYPYILLMSGTLSKEEALKSGGNDLLVKPISAEALEEQIGNAERLIGLVNTIGDHSEDFPSAGGIIAKSAFNQLLLSAMDRADRYGERGFLLQISVSNYDEILALDGAYGADFSSAQLCKYIVDLRRQSDIVGQTGKAEYSLLLQRPIYETEPVQAANRFAQELAHLGGLDISGKDHPQVRVSLIDVPIGALVIEHIFKPGSSAADSVSA